MIYCTLHNAFMFDMKHQESLAEIIIQGVTEIQVQN